MNGTSGFREVRSSTSRSPTNRLLREQRHLFGTGSWPLLATEELTRMAPHVRTRPYLPPPSLNRIAFLTNTTTKTEHVRESFRVSKTIFVTPEAIHFKQGR